MRKILFILITLAFSYGQNDYSLYYDGGDYLYNAIDDYRVNDSEGAISMWFNFDTDLAANAHIFASFYEGTSNARLVKTLLYYTGGDTTLIIQQDNADTDDNIWADTKVHTGWNHAVFVSTGTAYKIYINGVESALTVQGGSNSGDWFADVPAGWRDNICMGARISSLTDFYFKGYIDEVAVFSAQLTDDDVANIYNSGTPKDISDMNNLVDYWRFEEGTGTTSGPTTGSLTWQFGDGSTSSTFPTWSTETAGWDAADEERGFKTYGGFKKY